ncbi:hypothetical protein TMatcc_008217 [Talaromyces marneffei ATCC 18224]
MKSHPTFMRTLKQATSHIDSISSKVQKSYVVTYILTLASDSLSGSKFYPFLSPPNGLCSVPKPVKQVSTTSIIFSITKERGG